MSAIEATLATCPTPETLDRQVASDWLAKVREEIASKAKAETRPLRDYACTLIGAVIAESGSAFLQIGDGAVVVKAEGDDWGWVNWPQHGEFANTTYFVTDDVAFDSLQFDTLKVRVAEVAAFTDGLEALVLHYASRTVHTPFFERMLAPVRGLSAEGCDPGLSSALEEYLASPTVCERTDDDKTLLLATRVSANAPVDEPAAS